MKGKTMTMLTKMKDSKSSGGGVDYLGSGKHKVKVTGLKNETVGRNNQEGIFLSVEILETDNDDHIVGEEYQITWWGHHEGWQDRFGDFLNNP